jgi:FixJ family two-component response regulator/GGDEF domain-containing protein
MSKARILAVDDQRYFRELVEGLLSDEGYAVRTVASGEEALQVLEVEDFEIVLTDLVMPGIDGTELVRRVKERRPDQEIVMLTGVVDVKAAVEAMKLGATDYILKPFDRSLLVEAIDKILGRRQLRDEHARLIEENLEFMGALSLFERAAALFSTLAVEPLAERIVEGLCLETRAQTGVLWVADHVGASRMQLVGARGLVRVEDEPETIEREQALAEWCAGLAAGATTRASLSEEGDGDALYVALRFAGETIGLVRLADRVHGERFSEPDRAMAENFCEFGAIALNNAMRFRALERRSLRDPDTKAYTSSYFEDAVRNEIQKSRRFGHRFSILRLAPPTSASAPGALEDSASERLPRVQKMASELESALRASDLLAISEEGGYSILLPQTDALGAGILAQRIRRRLAESEEGAGAGAPLMSCVTFPVDGSQLGGLLGLLNRRIEQTRESLLVTRPELAHSPALDPLFDRLLELGSVEPVDLEGQILRFVLEEVVRRPADRGVLFLSPGARWLADVLEVLHEIRGRLSRTEIVLLGEGDEPEACPHLTWVAKSALDLRRPFVVYFGDGPAFAAIGQGPVATAKTPIFQTADRALVEYLAFELQRELAVPLSA